MPNLIALTRSDLDTLKELLGWWRERERSTRIPPQRIRPRDSNVQTVQINSVTQTDGRYPGYWYEYDASAKTYTQKDDIWIVERNGNTPELNHGYEGVDVGFANGQFVFRINADGVGEQSQIWKVREVDGTPTESDVNILEFDQADGFIVASGGSGIARVDYDGIGVLNGIKVRTQTFADVDDTNVTLAISSASSTHTFTMGWTGTLAIGRGGTGLGSVPLDGQLLIGNGVDYTLDTLTAGTGISIVNGAGSIQIDADHALLSLSHTDTDPVTPTQGDIIFADGTPEWTVLAIATEGQVLKVGTTGEPEWGDFEGTPATFIDFTESASAPADPASGEIRLYTKNDDKMYYRNDAGTEFEIATV